MDERIIKIANKYGYEPQALMLIEEMSELTKAICKLNRIEHRLEKGVVAAVECGAAVENLMDEMADVQIMLCQMQYFVNLSNGELAELMDKKIERQLKRIEESKSKR